MVLQKTDDIAAVRFPAPESEAMLNLLRDFRKVVQFIDENKVWLLPVLEKVSKG